MRRSVVVAVVAALGAVSVVAPASGVVLCHGHGGSEVADYNGDGVGDLAIGVPQHNGEEAFGPGAVWVLYGASATGLNGASAERWTQNRGGVPDENEHGDGFGSAVAAGDFNGDGYCDLAIGVPYEDVADKSNAGLVNVLYGSPLGLRGAGSQRFIEGVDGMNDDAEPGDLFGYSLAVGDFDGDGADDLAVGVLGEDVPRPTSGVAPEAGAAHIIYGSDAGLDPIHGGAPDQIWHQNQTGVFGTALGYDHFGQALAAGDFDNDDVDDLAIGVPGEDIAGVTDAGAVAILYGQSDTGLSGEHDGYWHQARSEIADEAEDSDQFGMALAAGDLGNGPADDLVVGVPMENLGGILDAGVVHVLYGAPPGGIGPEGDDLFWMGKAAVPPVPGAAGGDAQFGFALAVGDFDNNGTDDVAAGAPGSSTGGEVVVLYADDLGVNTNAADLWHQDRNGIQGASEPGDHFGAALGAGQFGEGGPFELAIGAPDETVSGNVQGGAVTVLRGGIRGLTADDDFWHEDLFGDFGRDGARFGATLR